MFSKEQQDLCKSFYRADGYLHCQDCFLFGACPFLVIAGHPFDSQDDDFDPSWEYCEFFSEEV